MPPKGKRHTCGHCQESFPNKSKLQAHLLTHDESSSQDLEMSVSAPTSTTSSPIKGGNRSTVACLPDSVRQNLLNSLPSPISSAILQNQRDAVSNKEVKNEIEANKFKEYKCNKCDKAFTTAGSHKRHQSGCKATSKVFKGFFPLCKQLTLVFKQIIQLEDDDIESDEMEEDIEPVPSSSDDEITFASSSFQTMKSKMTGNITRRVNSLLKEKKAKMVTCKVCKSKYNKDFGDCKKCKINALKKKVNEPKKQPAKAPKKVQEVCVDCGEIFSNKDLLSTHHLSCEEFLKKIQEKEKENVQSEDSFSSPQVKKWDFFFFFCGLIINIESALET